MEILIWVILSILVGVLANAKNRSFIGYTIISLLLSPLVGLIIVLIRILVVGEPKPKESIATVSKSQNNKTINRSYKNETYFINIENYTEDDFKIAKEKLIEQYQSEGYKKITIDTDEHWSLRPENESRGYIQIVLKNNIMKIEIYNVKSEPSIFKEQLNSIQDENKTDKLLELSRMLNKGLITEEEFLVHKNNLK